MLFHCHELSSPGFVFLAFADVSCVSFDAKLLDFRVSLSHVLPFRFLSTSSVASFLLLGWLSVDCYKGKRRKNKKASSINTTITGGTSETVVGETPKAKSNTSTPVPGTPVGKNANAKAKEMSRDQGIQEETAKSAPLLESTLLEVVLLLFWFIEFKYAYLSSLGCSIISNACGFNASRSVAVW